MSSMVAYNKKDISLVRLTNGAYHYMIIVIVLNKYLTMLLY